MSHDHILSDDYVAELLAKEATDCSLKYSAMGLEAFQSTKKYVILPCSPRAPIVTRRRPANKPKPNTLFLRHIIRDTDAHNKALLAKEAAESKARLEDLEQGVGGRKDRESTHSSRDIRKRQLGDIQAILGGQRRRRDGDNERKSGERHAKRLDGAESQSRRSSRRDPDDDREHGSRHRHHRHRSRERGSPSRDKRHRRDDHRSSRRRDRDDSRDSSPREHRHRHRRRDRSASPRPRRRSSSPGHRKRSHRERSPHGPAKSPNPASSSARHDSDPLDDFIGPAPPPRHRGRGAPGGAMGIDYRFSESYDPTTDVQMDGDGEGWEDAVEAFRDRQKLKQNQETRMKEAGFAVDQIERMKRGGREMTEEDVTWSKAGEKREWDRGKSQSPKGIFGELDDFDDTIT
ncbi:hypothetical protein B0I35DRAFT_254058 [Stachybotrys elegans]|uniref:Pre-mRNA-splicing factor 38B n=1 Tax=Stachybotrys elegans TaxID=80388 RepID=A0A8K0SPA5_9HYPO|nr:hypothetical protein B0I35DRAFT_254058 [Stachybotrys elegans]